MGNYPSLPKFTHPWTPGFPQNPPRTSTNGRESRGAWKRTGNGAGGPQHLRAHAVAGQGWAAVPEPAVPQQPGSDVHGRDRKGGDRRPDPNFIESADAVAARRRPAGFSPGEMSAVDGRGALPAVPDLPTRMLRLRFLCWSSACTSGRGSPLRWNRG